MYEKLTEDSKAKCMSCGCKLRKGDVVFLHASSAHRGHIYLRNLCEKCQIEIIFKATGKKYIRPKICKLIEQELVAKEV